MLSVWMTLPAMATRRTIRWTIIAPDLNKHMFTHPADRSTVAARAFLTANTNNFILITPRALSNTPPDA